MDEVTGLITTACVFVSLVFMIRLRRSKLVYIPDFQRGIRYTGDGRCTVLSPGSYRSPIGGTPITTVDMRPRQFLVESLQFQDKLHANGVISIGGELLVRDSEVAESSFKNLMEDSSAVIRERLRSAVLNSIIDSSAEGRVKMAGAIAATLNRELQGRGVELQNLEITELWVQPTNHEASRHAN